VQVAQHRSTELDQLAGPPHTHLALFDQFVHALALGGWT
jgi:hypothetical protein